jgi:pimeloyl-ACP methyl ester carboxylesterase
LAQNQIIVWLVSCLAAAISARSSGGQAPYANGLVLRVPVNGIVLQVKDFRRDGEAIVFLHSGGGNLMMWRRTVPFFEDRYRLVLVDLRGHGRSDKPRSGNQIDVMADDIAGLLDSLKIKKAHILGSSLGAEVGLSLAARYPGKVISLVCEGALYSECGPYGVWEGTDEAFRAEAVPLRIRQGLAYFGRDYPSASDMRESKKAELEAEGLWNDAFSALIEYDVFEREDGKFSGSWQPYAVEEYLKSYFHCRFEDYYRKVSCPVLMLPGKELLSGEKARAAMLGLSRLAKNARILESPDWVHPYGWLLNPEGMCRSIRGFLKSLE